MSIDIISHSLLLGALIHDIGKFAQRSQNRYVHHTECGAEVFRKYFREKLLKVSLDVDVDKVEEAIRDHHRKGVIPLISLADSLSAGERTTLEGEETGDQSKE